MSLILNDKELLSVDEDGTADYFCEGIRIDRVVCDFFTGEKNWQITLFDPTTGSHPVVVPRGLPARQLITKLRRAGLTCADDDDTIKAICDYLYDVSEPMAVREITHNRLGFQTINSNGEQVFLAHHPVCLSEPGKFVSTYYQPEKTMPKGSLKGWRKGMRSCILGRPNMELVLAMIALPQISHKLRENNLVNDVPIIAFIGPSSTGKTLSLRTLGSGYGRPVISSGIIDDLNCTMNSFYARMNGNYGWPILLDESTSKNNDWNFPSILYTLANGQDKARCDSSGAVRISATFSGAVFLSGEASLLQDAETKGVNARILEFTLPWTTGEIHANALECVIHTHHGHAVYPIVRWLLRHPGWIKEKFVKIYDELIKEFGSASGLDNRVLKIHAQIILSAEVVSRALHIPLNIDCIRKVLEREFKKTKHSNDTIEDAYTTLKTYILNNQSKFASNISRSMITSSALGYIGTHQGKDAVWLPKKTFENKIQQETNVDLNEISRELSKRGYLYRDSGRHYYTLQKFGPISLDCYILYLSDGKNSNNNPNKVTKSKLVKNDIKNKLNKSKSQMHSLLEEDDED